MAFQHDSVVGERGVRFPVTQFLVFFLPVAIIVLTASFWYISNRSNEVLNKFVKEQSSQLEHILGFIGAEVFIALYHLQSLANEEETAQAMASPRGEAVQTLQSSLLLLARRNPFYQQVRWIDDTGMERIRINRDFEEPYLVSPPDLQDKSKRYYFKESNRLLLGDSYISHIDLNVEHGQIENPRQPMLRVATPVGDDQGNRRGIMIINIALNPMFQVAQHIAKDVVDADYIVLNHEGFLLSGTLRGESTRAQFLPEVSFQETHPDLWKKTTEERSGNFESPYGVWVWKTIAPRDTIRSIAKALSPDDTIAPRIHSEGLTLTLLAFNPRSTLIPLFRDIRVPVTLGVIVVLIVYGVSLHIYLRGVVTERRAELNTAMALARAAGMERLKEVEERFRRVFEASSTGMIVVDDAGLIELSNPEAETLFGFGKGELAGFSVDKLLPADRQAQHAEWRREFMQAPETRKMGIGRELEAVTKDGKIVRIEVGLNPYLEHGKQLVLATIVDLSAHRKNAETTAEN